MFSLDYRDLFRTCLARFNTGTPLGWDVQFSSSVNRYQEVLHGTTVGLKKRLRTHLAAATAESGALPEVLATESSVGGVIPG